MARKISIMFESHEEAINAVINLGGYVFPGENKYGLFYEKGNMGTAVGFIKEKSRSVVLNENRSDVKKHEEYIQTLLRESVV